MIATDAQKIAGELIPMLIDCCDRITIAGSLRRQRPNVADLDLVVIPQAGNLLLLKNRLWKLNRAKPEKYGDKYLMLANYRGLQVDLYVATPETWATLLLIRTGSKEHNILLAKQAQALDMHMRANGEGLVRLSGPPLEIRTERDLFAALELPYKEPWEREA